jgi:ribosomal protein S1
MARVQNRPSAVTRQGPNQVDLKTSACSWSLATGIDGLVHTLSDLSWNRNRRNRRCTTQEEKGQEVETSLLAIDDAWLTSLGIKQHDEPFTTFAA